MQRSHVSPSADPEPSSGASALGGAAAAADDAQELLELQALAQRARQRIRRKRETQRQAEAMLVSTPRSVLVPAGPLLPVRPTARPSVENQEQDGERRGLLWLCVGAAVGAAAAGVLVFRGGATEPVLVATPLPAPARMDHAPLAAAAIPEPASEAAAIAAPAGALEEESDIATEAPVPPTQKTPGAAPKKPRAVARDAGKRKRVRDQTRTAARQAAKRPPPEPSVEPRAPAKKKSAIDSLFDDIDDAPQGERRSEAAEAPGAPEEDVALKAKLSRSDLARVMRRVAPKARTCGKKHSVSGTVMVKFTVQPAGTVSGAAVTGAHGGTPFGACLAGKVGAAKFPPVSGRATSFTYPFMLP